METLKIGRLLIIAMIWISCSLKNAEVCCLDQPEDSQHTLSSRVNGYRSLWRHMRHYVSKNSRLVLDGIDNRLRILRGDVQRYNNESERRISDRLDLGLRSLKSDIANSKTQIIAEVNQLSNMISTVIRPLNGCAYPFVLHGPSCYWISKNPADWEHASRACQNFGGQLVEIESMAEDSFLNVQMYHHNIVSGWIGLVKDPSTSSFLWRSGKHPLFTNWLIGEPNNGRGIENCGEIRRLMNEQDCNLHYVEVKQNCQLNLSRRLRWNDRRCSDRLSFICEKRL